MLSKEDNQLLTQTGPGTPMGICFVDIDSSLQTEELEKMGSQNK